MTEPENETKESNLKRSMSQMRQKDAFKIFIKTTDREFHLFTFEQKEAEKWGVACLTISDMKDEILKATLHRKMRTTQNSAFTSAIKEAKPEEEQTQILVSKSQASPVKSEE